MPDARSVETAGDQRLPLLKRSAFSSAPAEHAADFPPRFIRTGSCRENPHEIKDRLGGGNPLLVKSPKGNKETPVVDAGEGIALRYQGCWADPRSLLHQGSSRPRALNR